MFGFKFSKQPDGWVSIVPLGNQAFVVQVRPKTDNKPVVVRSGAEVLDPYETLWGRLNERFDLEQSRFVALLSRSQYQMVAFEAPSVPRAEWEDAIRWQLRDLVDFPVENAAIQVLEVPPADEEMPTRLTMAVACSADSVQAVVDGCGAVGCEPAAIDVYETALRNLVVALGDETLQATAMLVVGPTDAQLLLVYRKNLLISRNLELTLSDLLQGGAFDKQTTLERFALDVLRTFDMCERSYSYARISSLVILPMPGVDDLLAVLSETVRVPVKVYDFDAVFDLTAVPDIQNAFSQRQNSLGYALALGAALRPSLQES